MVALTLRDVSVSYDGPPILANVTFPSVMQGAVVGVLGPNGAGKSTLLRAIAGLLPHAGEIRLDSKRIVELSLAARAQNIGYLPQALPQASSLIAYEAVLSACRAVCPEFAKAEADAAVENAFNQLNIRHLAFSALNKLSGGQRQLIGLAQVIVRKPPVMLFDEPTSALDLRWQLRVFQVVRDIMADRAGICLMALHDINLAIRHCDHLLILAEGGVLAFGPRDTTISPSILRRAYGIEGRVEFCAQGLPFVITDGVIPPKFPATN